MSCQHILQISLSCSVDFPFHTPVIFWSTDWVLNFYETNLLVFNAIFVCVSFKILAFLRVMKLCLGFPQGHEVRHVLFYPSHLDPQSIWKSVLYVVSSRIQVFACVCTYLCSTSPHTCGHTYWKDHSFFLYCRSIFIINQVSVYIQVCWNRLNLSL